MWVTAPSLTSYYLEWVLMAMLPHYFPITRCSKRKMNGLPSLPILQNLLQRESPSRSLWSTLHQTWPLSWQVKTKQRQYIWPLMMQETTPRSYLQGWYSQGKESWHGFWISMQLQNLTITNFRSRLKRFVRRCISLCVCSWWIQQLWMLSLHFISPLRFCFGLHSPFWVLFICLKQRELNKVWC